MSFTIEASSERFRDREGEGVWRDVAWLLLATLLVRAAVFVLTNNENGDADARAVWGAVMYNTPHWITSGFWLPLHPYAVALLMVPFRDPVLAGKILSAVAGIATIVPFYQLTRLYFDRRTALLAGALFAVYGNHVGLSVLVMNETCFVLFAMLGLLYFAREMRSSTPRLGGFLLAGLMLSIGGGFRHEAWQLTGILMLWMLADARTRRFVVPYALVGFSFFLIWSFGNMMAGNGFMYSLTGVGAQKEKELATGDYSAAINVVKWVWIFVQSPGPLVTALGLSGLYLSIRRGRPPFHLAAIALLMMAPYWALSVVKAEWLPQHRYVVLPAILLFPYAAAAVWHFTARTRAVAPIVIALIAITLGTQAIAYGRHSSLYLPVKDYKANDLSVGRWLAENLADEDRLVVEDLDWRSPGVLRFSDHYDRPHDSVFQIDPPQRLRQAIDETGATVLVIASDIGKWPFLEAMKPEVVYRNDDYRVVRITRDRPARP